MALTKDQILSAKNQLHREEVAVPEFGEGATVWMRELTGDERDQHDKHVYENRLTFSGIRACLVALAMCDDEGNSLGFTEAEVKQLGAKSGAAIDRLFDVARRLSGMSEDSVKEAEKN